MMLSFQDGEGHSAKDEQDHAVLYEVQMVAFRDQEYPNPVVVARPTVRSLLKVSVLE